MSRATENAYGMERGKLEDNVYDVTCTCETGFQHGPSQISYDKVERSVNEDLEQDIWHTLPPEVDEIYESESNYFKN